MKNLSPQNRDVAEARSGGANWGANFSSVRPSCPEEIIPRNNITTGSERTEACGMKDHK